VTSGNLDVRLSHDYIARLDPVSAVPLGVPHEQIKERAAQLVGGKLELMEFPA